MSSRTKSRSGPGGADAKASSKASSAALAIPRA